MGVRLYWVHKRL